jgi:hypothetical protein
MKTLAGGSRRTRRMRGGDDRIVYSTLSLYKAGQAVREREPDRGEFSVSMLASSLSRNPVPAGAGDALKRLMEVARVGADHTIDRQGHTANLKSAFEAAYDEAVATGKIQAAEAARGGSRRTRKGRRVPRTRRRR